MDWTRFWWQSVGGARSMVTAIAVALLSGRSAVISDFNSIPWSSTLREAVELEYISSGGGKSVCYVDADGIEEAGEYLISQLQDSYGYRPSAQTPAAFIQSRGELRDLIFIVQNISPQSWDTWRALCKDLAGSVQFVLEFTDVGRSVSGAEHINFGEWVRDYDFAIFALAVAFSRNDCGGARTRHYIAELAYLSCKCDAVGILDFTLSFPPDGDPCGYGLAPEVVWRAQIRIAYHIVEEERRKFVNRYQAEIAACLPQSQYNETINDPENAELALLWHLSRTSHPLPNLTLLQRDEELLEFLRDARNALAHGKVLPPQNLMRLFAM